MTIYQLDSENQWLTARFSYDYPGTYDTPGRITQPGAINRIPALQGIQVPVRFHIGTMGVASPEQGRHSTVPPGKHGGNIDNWRIGSNATMYYPVLVEGALLSIGDSHFAQGDSELSGTAVEASVNCLLQITVRKDMWVSMPLLETQTAWMTHAFDPDLNVAMREASLQMIDFLQEFHGLSRDDAYSLVSVAADFSVTQVVDQRRGVHVSIPKAIRIP